MYKVYLADDETWVVMGLKKLIERSGYPFAVIGEANNGVTAFDEVLEKKPDILLTDIRMPGLNGLELMEKINGAELPVKVVFISGYAEFEYAQSALRMGAYDYLLKPIEQEKLDAVLERIMEEDAPIGLPGEEDAAPLSTRRQIVQYVKEHYTENITLVKLAEKYGMSVGYLSIRLKEDLNLPFSEYITSKRIQKAKELLANETLSVEAISEMVGYNDYFYFTKVFKKNTGISPSKYRKNLLK